MTGTEVLSNERAMRSGHGGRGYPPALRQPAMWQSPAPVMWQPWQGAHYASQGLLRAPTAASLAARLFLTGLALGALLRLTEAILTACSL